MDAASYLKSHGWQGDGHSLSGASHALKKPLLISRKVDVLGVGLNKHAAVSDQWWMRAFDQGLKDLGSGKKGTLANVREKGVHFGGLYGRFVQGDTVHGTIDRQDDNMAGQKRKRESADEGDAAKKTIKDVDGAKKAAKAEKRARKSIDGTAGPSSKQLDRVAKAFIVEALNRGLIPTEAGQRCFKSSAKEPITATYSEDAILEVFDNAGLNEPIPTKKGSKAAKYARERRSRSVKRAAKDYIIAHMPQEERDQIQQEHDASEEARKQKSRQKQIERDEREAAKTAAREAKRVRKEEKRAEKKLAAEQNATNLALKSTAPAAEAANGNFEINADEVKLVASTGKTKKIPGIGQVDRYPTKAEKKATKLEAQRREAEKKATTEKEEEESSDNSDSDSNSSDDDEEEEEKVVVPTLKKSDPKKANTKTDDSSDSSDSSDSESDADDTAEGGVPVFMVDTAGDADLTNAPVPTDATKPPVQVIDPEGNVRFTVGKDGFVPLDPAIWEGIKPKLLPKIVRKARRNWLAERREAKKAKNNANKGDAPPKKTKGARKAEQRETFVIGILVESRKAKKEGRPEQTATINNIANVPFVKVQSMNGPFTKHEMSQARTIARRCARHEKRKEREENGRGKGYKKREREAKKAAAAEA